MTNTLLDRVLNPIRDQIYNFGRRKTHKKTIEEIEGYAEKIEKYIQNIEYIKGMNNSSATSKNKNLEEGFVAQSHYESISNYLTKYNNLKSDLSRPFKLFVTGSGSYGKSTLINSLLAGDYATIDARPQTWKIDFYENKENNIMVELYYKNGERISVNKQRAIEIINEEEEKVHRAKQIIMNEKKKLKKRRRTLSIPQMKEYEQKIENENRYIPEINEVHWGVSNVKILDHLLLVDTPGLDQNNYSGNVQSDINHYAQESDGIIWMLNAEALHSKINKDVFSNINADNVIGVINRMDEIKTIEGTAEVIAEAEKAYGHILKTIIPYSALDVYEGHKTNNKKKIEQGSYHELIDAIERKYLRNAEDLQANRVHNSRKKYNEEIIKETKNFDRRLQNDYQKIKEGIKKINRLLSQEKRTLNSELGSHLFREKNKVHLQLSDHLVKASKISPEYKQREYLEKHVFQTEKLNNLLEGYINRANEVAEKHYFSILSDYYVTQYQHLELYKQIKKPNILRSNQQIESPSISMPSILGLSAVGGALGAFFGPLGVAVGAGLGGLVSAGIREDTVEKFTEEIDKYYQTVAYSYERTSNNYFENVYRTSSKQLEHSFTNIYELQNKLSEYELEQLVHHLKEWNKYLIKALEEDLK